jgi:hypothetical protein
VGEEPQPAGGYEAAATASAGLMAAALIERFSGLGISLALLLEGERVFAAGLVLRNRYIVHLGGVLLALPFFRVLVVDAPAGHEFALGTMTIARWTPLGLLMAGVFVANRRWQPLVWPYSAGAAILVFAVIVTELPSQWIAPACAALAIAAFLAGSRFRQEDVVWISLPAALFAVGTALVVNVDQGRIATTVLVVLITYAHQLLWRDRHGLIPAGLSLAATGLITALLFHEVSGQLLTVALGLEGAVLLVAGFILKERSYRLSGLLLFFFCVGKLFAYDLRELETANRILSFIVLGLVLLGASWVYARFREKLRRLL